MKYFGTDGIRGYVNDNINSKFCYEVGLGIGAYIIKNNLCNRVIIGKDTRESGDMIVYSISSALLDYGIDVEFVGIVPTACMSYLANKNDIGLAIMITASHNTWDMNGIKVFNNLGYKLPDSEEEQIEHYIDNNINYKSLQKGKFNQADKLVDDYLNSIYELNLVDLSGLNIALDCANGSNYKMAFDVFKKFNANVVPVANSSNGKLINYNCGAQFVENVQKEVLAHNCDYGFAFDGDADRLRIVLSDGQILDGDDILFIFANYMKKKNKLNSLTVVGTIMTNSGTEKSLLAQGIKLVRVQVGDKNVVEFMKKNNYSLGGESSGHICLHEYNTTCDALFNAIYFLKIILQENINVKDCLLKHKKAKQTLKNIDVTKEFRKNFDIEKLENEINKIVEKNEKKVRIVIRPSGTEPVFRIMIESDSEELNLNVLPEIVDILKLKKAN